MGLKSPSSKKVNGVDMKLRDITSGFPLPDVKHNSLYVLVPRSHIILIKLVLIQEIQENYSE